VDEGMLRNKRNFLSPLKIHFQLSQHNHFPAIPFPSQNQSSTISTMSSSPQDSEYPYPHVTELSSDSDNNNDQDQDVIDVNESASNVSKSKTTSNVWKIFTIVQNGKKAKCNICDKIYTRNPQATSNLINHAKSAHKQR
jgi:hypothetical protein